MITATHDMILLNKRLNRETRRDVYVATQISGVSFYHKRESAQYTNRSQSKETYNIRIPVDAKVQGGKTYLPEPRFDELSDREAEKHWTLHVEDLIVVCASPLADVNNTVFPDGEITEDVAQRIADSLGIYREMIHIVSYSDDTMRGSPSVRHWRIGGA